MESRAVYPSPAVTPIAQDIDDDPERSGMLAAVGGVEVVASKGLAPIVQHPHQGAVGNLVDHHVLRKVSQPAPRDGRAQDRDAAVECPLPLDACLECVTVFFEIPLHQASLRGQLPVRPA